MKSTITLLITYNNRMKLCRQMVNKKKQLKEQKFCCQGNSVGPRLLSEDFVMCTLFASVDEIK